LISLLRGDLDWIVMKCLEKDRTRRYDTANGLALDVIRHLGDEPVVARPPTVVYQLQKAWRRNKVVYTASAAVAIALLLGTGISIWQARIANVARERAVQEERRAKEGERKQRMIAYASDMKVAQGDLRENNLTRVVELLNRYVPKPGEEDLRGIEWRYLWQAAKGDEIHTFMHNSMVSSISLSADGSRLASSSINGKIRLFDVESQKLLQEQDGGLRLGGVQDGSVALSPDGHLLAADEQGTLTVRNADNGELVFEHKQVVAPICFSPDSRSLAGTTDAGLRIWSTADWTSRLLGEPFIKTSQNRSLTFTPDSSRVIFCPTRYGHKLMVWNLTDNTMEGELTGMDMPCANSTDGSIVAAGGWGGEVCVWDLASRRVIKKFRAHNGLVFGVALSPDGKTLATGGNDQVIRLWDTKTFENIRSLKGHHSEIWNLKFSSNGQVLASASKDLSVKLWDWKTQPDSESEYLVPKNLYCRGFSESGDVLRFYDPKEWPGFSESGEILAPEDRPAGFELPRPRTDHLLDFTTGKWTHVIRSDSEAVAGATSMTWESDQDTELFGKEDGTVVLSDGTTTRSIHVANHPVQPLLLSPKGRYLLLNALPRNAEPYAILWDLEAEGAVGEFPRIKKGRYPMKQAISPDECFLAYNGDNYSVKLWHIPEKREWATLEGHTWHLFGVEFSPDSCVLASFGWDADCRLWDVEKGEKADPHLLRGHRSGVDQAIFSPDGRTVATSSDDSLCKLWSVATGQELLSLPSPRVFPLFQRLPMMAAKADRIVWGGYSQTHQSWDSADDVPLRVTPLPSLAEIDEEIRRQSSGETLRGSGDGQD
jgi:WD40 repeat protein